jgi:hypothetical protein
VTCAQRSPTAISLHRVVYFPHLHFQLSLDSSLFLLRFLSLSHLDLPASWFLQLLVHPPQHCLRLDCLHLSRLNSVVFVHRGSLCGFEGGATSFVRIKDFEICSNGAGSSVSGTLFRLSDESGNLDHSGTFVGRRASVTTKFFGTFLCQIGLEDVWERELLRKTIGRMDHLQCSLSLRDGCWC